MTDGPSPVDLFGTMFERPTLFFDVDNTLAYLSDAMAIALNAAFGTSYVSGDITVYRWADVLPKEQGHWLNDYLTDPTIFRNLSPIIPAIRCVQKAYAAGYTVNVITDRPASLGTVTAGWLAQHDVPYDNFGLKQPGGSKLTYLEDYGPDNPAVLIDDDPKYAHLAPRDGVDVYAPRWPYTQEVPGVLIFDDWHEVKDKLGI